MVINCLIVLSSIFPFLATTPVTKGRIFETSGFTEILYLFDFLTFSLIAPVLIPNNPCNPSAIPKSVE